MKHTLYKWVMIVSTLTVALHIEFYQIKAQAEPSVTQDVQDGYKQINPMQLADATNWIKVSEPKPSTPKPTVKVAGAEPDGRKLSMKATAYTLSAAECGNTKGITFTGTKVKEHRTVAVDPRVIPLGSLLYIESDHDNVSGYYVAEDTGSAIKGKKLDVYFGAGKKAYKDAMYFGKRTIDVTIVREGYEKDAAGKPVRQAAY